MNRPYHLDAEAIARRLNLQCKTLSLRLVVPSRHLPRSQGPPPPRESATTVGRDGSDVVSVKCWAGCDRDSVRRAIEGATGWRIWGQRIDDSPVPRTSTTLQNRETPRDRTEYARQLWAASFRIDQDPDHPVRRWVARRGLYWPAPVPLPSCIRWLPAGLLSQQHQGAGAIVAAFAPHDEWAERWPYLPNATCIELVHLDAEGLPALDKPAEEGGLGKRSYGIRQGAVCLLGDPRTGVVPSDW